MNDPKARFLLVVGIWVVANFVPHLLVFLATGKLYFQLAARWAIICESAVMLLNLFLPIVAVYWLRGSTEGVLHSLGWEWGGWRIAAIGAGGLLVMRLLILLLVLTAVAEETMFRGLIQTDLTRDFGPWIGIVVAALLFGIRHLPMDLYGGLSQSAPTSAWASRMLQLYISALFFGIARHWAGSNWAS